MLMAERPDDRVVPFFVYVSRKLARKIWDFKHCSSTCRNSRFWQHSFL